MMPMQCQECGHAWSVPGPIDWPAPPPAAHAPFACKSPIPERPALAKAAPVIRRASRGVRVTSSRKQKPPGFEKWTWPEINAGRKMSKTEKRYRRLAKHMGATEGEDGEIVPPKFADNPGYYVFFVAMIILIILVAVLSKK